MSNGHEATLRRFQNPPVRQSAAMGGLVGRAGFAPGGGGGAGGAGGAGGRKLDSGGGVPWRTGKEGPGGGSKTPAGRRGAGRGGGGGGGVSARGGGGGPGGPGGPEREQARWLIWEIGQQAGVRPASIHELYLARGRGEVPPFTTPAMNVRLLAYDTARAVFRAAQRLDVGALICEIARSEIGYTEQRPAEYVAVMIAAALREGFVGPLFIQGDHVQVNAKKYAADPEAELQAVRTLIEEELHAGFYNIDVDTSTLVDLSQKTLDEQQRVNYERAAELTRFIRDRESEGVTVSVGAEIGEVGGKNSDVHELKAFMEGYNRTLKRLGPSRGISKISVH